jgi:hypothetical protein
MSDSSRRTENLRENSRNREVVGRLTTAISVLSLLVAIVAIILALLLRGSEVSAGGAADSCSTTTSDGSINVASGDADAIEESPLSAYDLWLSVGNVGTLQDFLDSLVGEPQPITNIYIGSDGVSGQKGAEGKSAYQLWLDAGNVGTPDDFLQSLKGLGGNDGEAGLSAYDLWISQGNVGDVDDFFDALVGLTGSTGATGATGPSAFDVWVANGGVGGVAAFLESLKGEAGATGPQGQCTVGDTGPSGVDGATGATGLSAYEIWKLNGHSGSEELFLLSLIGPTGVPGAQGIPGAQGPAGEQGPQGIQGIPGGQTGFGDSGSFWDLTTQGESGAVSGDPGTAHPIYFGESDSLNNSGVSMTAGPGDAPGRASFITFTSPGVYNISFSAQLLRTQGGSADTVSIWLRKNGTNEPNTNTDVTLVSNGQKHVAAWNFFVPVACSPTCDTWQLMWSADAGHTNIWYQDAQANPTRPAIPSVILTVNQVG